MSIIQYLDIFPKSIRKKIGQEKKVFITQEKKRSKKKKKTPAEIIFFESRPRNKLFILRGLTEHSSSEFTVLNSFKKWICHQQRRVVGMS